MTSNELRRSYLEFFEQHGHRIIHSAPLVPADDPTLLFTNAGMNQFKDVFLGKDRRDYRRATSSQKCMRVSGKHNDLENVGPSLRHHTFFEMLGNFSFGDYFKQDAIALAWSLLTDVWKLPADRLNATVFAGDQAVPRDDEAYGYWRRVLPAGRIYELGAADNFWAMGETGPCGRCSEIHYYRGDTVPCTEPVCRGLECSCDRFVEVWNNVFMEFDRQPDGSLQPLPAPSIDTGMGLERITAIMQGVTSNYDTDLFSPLFDAIGAMTDRRHGGTMDPADVSMRVIADHVRATAFLVADGVVPSNEWRGYVLRKIMRRAMRHGNRLGLTEPFLYRLVEVLVRKMGDAYPELRSGQDYVTKIVHSEEERFESLLVTGLPRLEDLLDRSAPGPVAGDEVFRLYDSYGLPYDFIEDVAAQRNLALDKPGFDHAMEAQKTRARASSGFGGAAAVATFTIGDHTRAALEQTGDAFEGYDQTRLTGVPIVAVLDAEGREAAALGEGAIGYVALAKTPFYLESGGQASDVGRLAASDQSADAVVAGMARGGSRWPRLHRVRVTRGSLKPGDLVDAQVDVSLRDATRRNHTATHLLQAALRQVLGAHVKQAGSLVTPDRLRFDFVHFTGLSPDELAQTERLVNQQVFRNTQVDTQVRSTQEAMAAGATALFGEKYGDTVRVVAVPGFSLELCGGTHVKATGDIGPFIVIAEGGIAAGVRRIEAITGAEAVAHMQAQRRTIDNMLSRLNVPSDQAVDVIERLQGEVKRLTREVSQLKMKAAVGGGADEAGDVVTIGTAKVLTRKVVDLDKSALRELADSLKTRLGSGIVVLGAAGDGRVQVVVSVTADLTARVHAGKLVKLVAPIVGGGGGGRPDFAEAGGKSPEKLDELMATARTTIAHLLEG
ncbi:MAG: alanine--tRNA ligase [Acidobacteria bacterium]|nr:alanine--tRNA ligase [Acidobacteriota bacterium]